MCNIFRIIKYIFIVHYCISSPCAKFPYKIMLSSSVFSTQGQVFHCKLRHQGCSSVQRQVFYPQTQAPRVAALLWMNRCGSFLILSALHSLFSVWTDLKRSEKIPGALAWRCGEWIWLNGLSGLHRNSPQELNIISIRVSDRIKDLEIPINIKEINLNFK